MQLTAVVLLFLVVSVMVRAGVLTASTTGLAPRAVENQLLAGCAAARDAGVSPAVAGFHEDRKLAGLQRLRQGKSACCISPWSSIRHSHPSGNFQTRPVPLTSFKSCASMPIETAAPAGVAPEELKE